MVSLKIIHVANFSLKPRGAGFYGVCFKLSNGLVRSGHRVLPFSDRDVARSANIFGSRQWGVRPARRALVQLVHDFSPDIVLFGHADTIAPDTLDEIRDARPGAKLAQWNVDPLFDPSNVERINSKIQRVDVTFVTTAGAQLDALRAEGHRAAFLPNPVDPAIECGRAFEFPRRALRHDLLFATGAGSLARHHAGRTTSADEIAARIVARLPQLRGDFPGANGAPCKFGRDYEEALANSAMGLNISRRNDVTLYSSDRLAHLMGSGLLTLIDRASGYDTLFGDDELVFYVTEEEMIEKIAAYLIDDSARRRVARAGWKAYRSMFDCCRVAEYMIDVLFGCIDPAQFRWARP